MLNSTAPSLSTPNSVIPTVHRLLSMLEYSGYRDFSGLPSEERQISTLYDRRERKLLPLIEGLATNQTSDDHSAYLLRGCKELKVNEGFHFGPMLSVLGCTAVFEDKDDARVCQNIYLTLGRVQGALNESQFNLLFAYERVRKGFRAAGDGLLVFTEPLPIDGVVSSRDGGTQGTFLLPNLEPIGNKQKAGLGLGSNTTSHQLHEVRYDKEGIWLTMSGQLELGERVYSHVLLDHELSGREAVLRVYTPSQYSLYCAYRSVSREYPGPFTFDEPLAISDVVQDRVGQTQSIFLLPNFEKIGAAQNVGLGFGCNTTEHLLHEVRHDKEGIWLTMSGQPELGERVYTHVLLDHEKSGKGVVLKVYTPSQYNLYRAYRSVSGENSGPVKFQLPLLIDGVVQPNNGMTRGTYLLPNLEHIGGRGIVALGFGSNTTSHLLHEVRYDKEGIWLTMSGQSELDRRVYTHVLLDHKKGGREAVLKVYTPSQYNLYRAYRSVSREHPGPLKFKEPLQIDGVVQPSGGITQVTYLLPNLEHLGERQQVGLGFGKNTKSHLLHEVRYDQEGIWLRMSGQPELGERVYTHVLLDHEKSGKEAVLKVYTPSQYNLWCAMNKAKVQGSYDDSPVDASEFLKGKSGTLARVMLLANGVTYSRQLYLRQGDVSFFEPVFSEISYLPNGDSGSYLIKCEYGEGDPRREFHLAVSDTDITVADLLPASRGDRAVDLAKGHALDRLLSHVLANSEYRKGAEHQISRLSLRGDVIKPNASISSGTDIVHAKWGTQGGELLDYMLRYTRGAQRLQNDHQSARLRFAVADPQHVKALTECATVLTESLDNIGVVKPELSVCHLSELSECGTDRRDWVRRELARIEQAAICGELEWLCSLTYPESLPAGEVCERADVVNPEDLSAVQAELLLHRASFSLYWETSYHLELALFCAKLLQNMRASSEIRDIVASMYPELRGTEEEIRALTANLEREREVNDSDQGKGSDSFKPVLTRFELAKYLIVHDGDAPPSNLPATKPKSDGAQVFGDPQYSLQFQELNSVIKGLQYSDLFELSNREYLLPFDPEERAALGRRFEKKVHELLANKHIIELYRESDDGGDRLALTIPGIVNELRKLKQRNDAQTLAQNIEVFWKLF